jgi:protocatechuate 3,4-dioxygenase beta subunit
LLILSGIVSDHRRRPVSGAVVEIWQTDADGYYDHPRARGEDPLDEYWRIERADLDAGFLYFGSVETTSAPSGAPRWESSRSTRKSSCWACPS